MGPLLLSYVQQGETLLSPGGGILGFLEW